MIDLKEKILEACARTEKLRRDLLDKATKEYFATSGLSGSPAAGDFDIAQTRTRSLLKRKLFSSTWISAISDGSVTDDRSIAAMALTFDSIASPLQIPKPSAYTEPKEFSVALSALAGAVVGMVVLTPLFRIGFDMRDVGLVLGGPLGAFCMVLIVRRLSRSRFFLKLLWRIFGVAERLPGYERRSHEEVVRMSIEQWLNLITPLLVVLCFYKSWSTDASTDEEIAFRRLGKLIYAMHSASSESLPVMADELIQEARNCGFEGLEGSPEFLSSVVGPQSVIFWTNDLQNKYEPFGHIAEGDQVKIERQPVIFDGKVMERGLVRKLRDKT
ncbi:MAG: hypothetical protein H8D56_22990 [Planctomycetes bacterium]|nr:hypothetical protein [Planctomycetota bacterium]MBL7147157.1 hypothetical protein [Phycisphaerae bacterium]